MGKKVAFLFPGQGAQYPGMGHEFYKNYPAAKAVFAKADEILKMPFSELIFHGSSEDMAQTKNSQLAIFITSIAILRVVQEHCPELVAHMCAGLSLGEYTALVAAGKLSFEEALPLVSARAAFMQEACESHPGTLHVVLGLKPSVVEEVVNQIENLWIANLNCPGQIVIAGTFDAIEKAGGPLKEAGAKKIIPLEVSGAFHSALMQEAQNKLKPFIDKVEIKESSIDVVMNVTGALAQDPSSIRSNMIQQVTSAVYWQKGIEAMEEEGIELFIEMGPGKTLSTMNKRIGVKARTISIENIEDLTQIQGAECTCCRC